MKKKLFIISNESVSLQDGKFYCDNIDLKSTPEGLNKKYEVNLFTRTLSKCILNKKLEKTNINKNKKKIINIEIPGDIMSFLKINATHSDIDDIIKIAYNVTLTNLE